jgi:hypothetical protein
VLTRSVVLGAFVATAIFPAAVIGLNLIQAGRHDSLRQLASVIRCSPSRGGGPPICFGDLRNRSQRHSLDHSWTVPPSIHRIFLRQDSPEAGETGMLAPMVQYECDERCYRVNACS